ncbi:helix-turn-helix domain-containing protein [Streptococcus sp. HF-100]|uniref:helix-turn-helix domain-containing protein n=1 Tax=Streptococcus sp. HF-100 TaxID=2785791 RepID=UPI00189D0EEB|nr:helix-turn-helix domain-containing protein [Streptococcus sp. HF-100]MBF7076077.1 helix-turn-helix domain-containing protein [Streptococcus sp. HF-100]
MQVTLPDEQIHQLQLLISRLIENEIKNKLDSNNIESPFLNKQQACKYLRIANNTLDSWIKKGLPVIRVGKTVRFDKAELNHWLQNQ